jgi:drug/metabolite transporter (DMT)-like permease
MNDKLGILLIILGMSLFSIQDVTIKVLAEDGSLLQILVMRGFIGTAFISAFLYISGRPIKFTTAYPLLTCIRATLFFFGFMSFYIALSLMPIAEATALFFVSPFFITILSKIFLGNDVGWYRIAAILTGFIGTFLIVKPSTGNFQWAYILPLLTALSYSISMILAKYTREKDTVFQQTIHMYIASIICGTLTLIMASLMGWSFDGVQGLDYVFRPWVFDDLIILSAVIMISMVATIGTLCLISAYRISQPPVIAPFEYTMLVISISIGLLFFGEVPDIYSVLGMLIIVASGLFIFIREQVRGIPLAIKIRMR